ncbi:MAG TPA: HYR domain-containing protein [Gemmatimonadaceae bacterium]
MTIQNWMAAARTAAILILASPAAVQAQGQPNSSIRLTSLVPASIATGSSNLDLVVRGTGFTSKSQVRINGEHRATTFVSASEVRTRLIATDVASATSHAVSVFTPGAGSSNMLSLAIETPASTADTEPPRFTTTPTNLTIPATSPAGAYVALVLPLATDNSGSVTVTSQPPPVVTTLFPVGTSTVVYTATDPTGNKTTISSTITVTPQAPPPTMTISTLEPGSAIPGARGFGLIVKGSGFTSGMIVRWNGGNRPTSFSSPTGLSAIIPTTDLISPGSTSVTVFNPATGSETPATDFQIDASASGVPRITALSKTTAPAGATVFIDVTGDGFVAGSIVRWNGVDLAQGYVSLNGSHTLSAEVSATLVGTPGTYRVTVFNAGPNGGESNALQVTITSP